MRAARTDGVFIHNKHNHGGEIMDANKKQQPVTQKIEGYEEMLEELYNDKEDRDSRMYWL